MTPQAEVMWLDGLEKLPAKTVVVFTTNNLHKLTDRFVRRCEVQRFDATSDEFRDGMVDVVRQVWKRETGTDLDTIPQDLGKFELGSDEYSIGSRLAADRPVPADRRSVACLVRGADRPRGTQAETGRVLRQHQGCGVCGQRGQQTQTRLTATAARQCIHESHFDNLVEQS